MYPPSLDRVAWDEPKPFSSLQCLIYLMKVKSMIKLDAVSFHNPYSLSGALTSKLTIHSSSDSF